MTVYTSIKIRLGAIKKFKVTNPLFLKEWTEKALGKSFLCHYSPELPDKLSAVGHNIGTPD